MGINHPLLIIFFQNENDLHYTAIQMCLGLLNNLTFVQNKISDNIKRRLKWDNVKIAFKNNRSNKIVTSGRKDKIELMVKSGVYKILAPVELLT